MQWRNKINGDMQTVDPEGALPAFFALQPDWERVVTEEEVTEPIPDGATHQQVPGPRGKALDEALEAAGLPLSGTADEKRTLLAEHVLGDPDPVGDPAGDTVQPVEADNTLKEN